MTENKNEAWEDRYGDMYLGDKLFCLKDRNLEFWVVTTMYGATGSILARSYSMRDVRDSSANRVIVQSELDDFIPLRLAKTQCAEYFI